MTNTPSDIYRGIYTPYVRDRLNKEFLAWSKDRGTDRGYWPWIIEQIGKVYPYPPRRETVWSIADGQKFVGQDVCAALVTYWFRGDEEAFDTAARAHRPSGERPAVRLDRDKTPKIRRALEYVVESRALPAKHVVYPNRVEFLKRAEESELFSKATLEFVKSYEPPRGRDLPLKEWNRIAITQELLGRGGR